MVEVLTRYSNTEVVDDLRRTLQVVMESRGKPRHDGLSGRPVARKVLTTAKKKRKQLSEEQARQLVADWNGGNGIKQKDLAVKYGISLATVERIVKRYRP